MNSCLYVLYANVANSGWAVTAVWLLKGPVLFETIIVNIFTWNFISFLKCVMWTYFHFLKFSGNILVGVHFHNTNFISTLIMSKAQQQLGGTAVHRLALLSHRRFLHVLLTSALVLCGYFLPQSNDIKVRLIGYCKSAVGVNVTVTGCLLFNIGPVMSRRPVQDVPVPSPSDAEIGFMKCRQMMDG